MHPLQFTPPLSPAVHASKSTYLHCAQCAGGVSYDGPRRCCSTDHPCEMLDDNSQIGYCPFRAPPTCARINEQCAGDEGILYSVIGSCCSPNQHCKMVSAGDEHVTRIGICTHNTDAPFEIADVKSCSSVPKVEIDALRRDCPSGQCAMPGYPIPSEMRNAGVFRSDNYRGSFAT